MLGAGLTFLSVRIADRPADETHTYGHEKFENVSAFAETLLMAASSVWILYEAMERLFVKPVSIAPALWPVLVLLLSMALDLWRSRRLRAVARAHRSAALEADALHFSSDVWSSAAVLLGLAATWAGQRAGIRWLSFADPLAAVAVSIVILRFGWKLAAETLSILLDAVPSESRTRMLNEVARLEDVLAVEQARVRRAGKSYFTDLTLALPRSLSFQRTEALVEQATDRVRGIFHGADVVIRTVPRESSTESIFDRVRAVAGRNNVNLHDLSIQAVGSELHVEQHVEVPERMTLREAHDFVCRLEAEIRRDVPEVHSVLTHIESQPATIETPENLASDQRQLDLTLRECAHRFPEIIDIHEVTVSRSSDHLQVSCHCTMPDMLSMHRVHSVMTELEDRFKLSRPDVYRVLIHPAPETASHHEPHPEA
jgi:cation diffusion facilitator family transporter